MGEIRGTVLTVYGQQALLAGAESLSEGAAEEGGDGEPIYHGSTLLTVALDRGETAGMVRALGPEGIASAAARSIGLHVRLMRLARLEVERRVAPLLLRGMRVEVEFSVEGERLLVDIGVECPLARPETEAADGDGEPR